MNTRRGSIQLTRNFLYVTFLIFLSLAGIASSAAQASASVADAASFQQANQLYQRGRQLQLSGKEADAAKVFSSSLALTQKLITSQPSNLDYVSLHIWNLFRLGRHSEVVSLSQKTLLTARDHRIYETMGESLYFLERNEEALYAFASYVELAPERDERMSSAYYFMGECLVRLKRYEHADIALSTATTMEKNMYYWWYRLGFVKELLGQYKKAYEAFGTSISLNAGFKPAIEGRTRVKAKAGL